MIENQLEKKFDNSVIYKITNPNGSMYIGQTIDFKRRCSEYKRNFNTKSSISYSIEKYGYENHIFEIIEQGFFTKEELDTKEKYYIQLYDTYKNGLNMTLGGDKGTIGYRHTLETRKKLSRKRKLLGNVHPHTIVIYQYDLNYNFLRKWNSLSEAEKYYNQNNNSNGFIGRKLKNKRIIKSKGFLWSREYIIDKEIFIQQFTKPKKIRKKTYNKKNILPNALKVVLKKDNQEEIYKSFSEFCRIYNCKINYLFDRLNGYPAEKFLFEILFYSKEQKLLVLTKK